MAMIPKFFSALSWIDLACLLSALAVFFVLNKLVTFIYKKTLKADHDDKNVEFVLTEFNKLDRQIQALKSRFELVDTNYIDSESQTSLYRLIVRIEKLTDVVNGYRESFLDIINNKPKKNSDALTIDSQLRSLNYDLMMLELEIDKFFLIERQRQKI